MDQPSNAEVLARFNELFERYQSVMVMTEVLSNDSSFRLQFGRGPDSARMEFGPCYANGQRLEDENGDSVIGWMI